MLIQYLIVAVNEDAWPSSEKSFGKEPSSVSPDADDLLQLGKGECSSGGSNSTGNGQNLVSSRKAPQSSAFSSKNQQSPPLIVKNSKEVSESSRRRKNSGQSSKSEDMINVLKPTGHNKTVVWNVTDLSLESHDSSKIAAQDAADPEPTDLIHVDTIKRSPLKRSDVSDKVVAVDFKQSGLPAWDARQDANRSSPAVDTSMLSPSSSLIKDFDPLLQDNVAEASQGRMCVRARARLL